MTKANQTKQAHNQENENTLFSLSGEFLEAARVLQATPPIYTTYSPVTYYLLGHSAELMLKAFLCQRGVTIHELVVIGHNLEELISRAKEQGLSESVKVNQISALSNLYGKKFFEYRTRTPKSFPCIFLLIEEVERLQLVIFDRLWDL